MHIFYLIIKDVQNDNRNSPNKSYDSSQFSNLDNKIINFNPNPINYKIKTIYEKYINYLNKIKVV